MYLEQPLGYIGRHCNYFLSQTGSFCKFAYITSYWTFVAPFREKIFHRKNFVAALEKTGVRSIPIVSIVAFLIGIILVLQGAYQLKRFGQLDMVSGFVAVALLRELSPLLTGIVITGRIGASFAAELGTMKVSEEILAMETMAINPVGFLVAPRFLALLIMSPCLTFLSDIVGMAGGYLVGTVKFGINPSVYISQIINMVCVSDVVSGLIKSVVFAFFIAMVSCYQAFTVSEGAEGVGTATMMAVVVCLVLIIVSDAIMTAIFAAVLGG